MQLSTPVYLTPAQIDKLRRVLTPTIPIYPSPPTSSFPTLHITPKNFLRQVLLRLKEHSIDITSVRLHGGASSYVLINDSDFVYRDIDILFLIKTPLSSQQQTTLFSSNSQPYLCDVWTIIKYVISSCLIEYIPNTATCTQYFISSVLDTYTKKNIKITSEQDSWALLSLQNLLGQNLELKFVENLKRQWQFSVDSFQIDLKPLLLEKSPNNNTTTIKYPQSITTNIQTNSLIIDAINSLNIINKDKNDDDNNTTANNTPSPLEFGFFTPSSSPDIRNNNDRIQYPTLTTITTIQTSKNNNATSESRSCSPKLSESPLDDDDDQTSNTSYEFQAPINDDADDGFESEAGDSTNEDDNQSIPTSIESDNNTSSTSSIEVFSLYKNLQEALEHLNNKLIATYEPETMRGGGLLKYCDLLARNYKLYDAGIMTHMQRYMCSRFFIDYKTLREQLHVIAQYVSTHYLPTSWISNFYTTNNSDEIFHPNIYQQAQLNSAKYFTQQIDQVDLINARLCLLFFEHLSNVIQQSTVCLTHEDRELLLYNILILYDNYHREYEHLFREDSQHQLKYHTYNHPHQHQRSQYTANSSSHSSRSSSPSGLSSKSSGSHRGYPQRNHRQPAHSSYRTTRGYSNQYGMHRQNQS